MRLNIAGGHALGVHGHDFLLNLLTDAGLVLFQNLGFKFSLAVSRNRHLHIAKTGAQRFAAVAVAAVVCIFVFVVELAVAQLVIQFCLQAILHEFGDGFLEQILDIIHATDICHLQQLADLLSTGIFFLGAVLSGHMVNLLCGTSILHHAGGLHKLWDGLAADGTGKSCAVCNRINDLTKLKWLFREIVSLLFEVFLPRILNCRQECGSSSALRCVSLFHLYFLLDIPLR